MIKPFCDKADGQGLAIMINLTLTVLSCHLFFYVKIPSEELTIPILEQLLKSEASRLHWIKLLADSGITVDSVLYKLLKEYFKKWLDREESEEGEYFHNEQPFHSRIIELASSPTFQNAKLYHSDFMEILDKRERELWLSNERWTSNEIKIVYDCGDTKSDLWEKILRKMNDIPSMEELNKDNMESASKKLCQNLDYCLNCQLWFELENPMQTQLLDFFNKVWAHLIENKALLPIYVYKYLVEHLKAIQGLSSTRSTALDEVIKEYEQFSNLINTFKRIYDDFFIEDDLSEQLKTLEKESNSWEMQGFLNVKDRYAQEIKLLEEHEQSMKVALSRRESLIFCNIWKNSKTEHESSKDQQHLSIFNKIFQDSNQKWENFKQDLQNRAIKYKDLKLMFTGNRIENGDIKKRLTSEIHEQQQTVIDDVDTKTKKKDRFKRAIGTLDGIEEVTNRIKEYHPYKDKIQDDDRWKEYVQALARIEEVTRTEIDISIAKASQYYDACVGCVDKNVSSYAKNGFFNVLLHCENELKILASDSNFTNNTNFERILRALKESSHQGLQQLTHSLECVNPVMQKKLWQCQLNNMTDLVKAILSLCPNNENFVQMLKNCCDANLANISSL
ncbi:SMC domain-containing protein, partial [Reticulomyxa filosa]